MIFISVAVFVASCSVTVTLAFPDSNSQAVTTGKFSKQWSDYQKINEQNAYLQNRPQFQAVNAPLDEQTAFTNTQGARNIGSRQSSIEYNRSLPPTNVPRPINNVQISNFPINNGEIKFPTQAPALHPTLPNDVIREIYKALKPTKMYTIIHPNGTIEHTDELQSIAARHPNYVLVKADDILSKHNPTNGGEVKVTKIQSNQNIPIVSPVASIQRPSPTKIQTNQNIAQTSTTNQISYANQQSSYIPNLQGFNPTTISPSGQQTVNFQKPTISATQPNTNTQSNVQQLQGNKVSITNFNEATQKQIVPSIPTELPFVSQKGPLKQYEVIEVQENLRADAVASNPSAIPYQLAQTGVKNSSPPQNIFDVQNAVAANPLPIYPIKPEPQEITVTDASYASPAAVSADAKATTLPIQQPLLDLKNSDQDIILNPPIINNVDEAILALNTINNGKTTTYPTPAKSIFETNSENVQNVTVPVILPEVEPQVPLSEIEIPSSVTTTHADTNKAGVTTIYGANENNDTNKVTSPQTTSVLKPNINEIIDVNTSNNAVDNNTNTSEIVKEFIASSTVDHNSSNAVKTLKTSNGVSYTMFGMSDDSLWDIIRSNSQNVYFFFLPPKPKNSTIETTKTIFPNGTIIEEITETVTDYDQDGEPVLSKTTRVVIS